MMSKWLFLLVLSIAAIMFTQCGKDEGICIGSTGQIIVQDRAAVPFHYLEVYDNINLFLKQDSTMNAIRVEAGENLIDGITTEIDSGRLVLRNINSCNWLRSFEVPVNVYVTFSRLDTLVFKAAGNITCTNEWTNDSIYLDVIEGAGILSINLNVFKSFIYVRYGTVSLDVTGFSQVTFLSSQGYGPLHAEELFSKFTYVYTFSPNDVFVYASGELGVEIANIGNVYYRGDPEVVKQSNYGGGELIKF